MINIRYGKNISFVWVITLNGQEVDLTGHTVQVELTLPNNNKVIIKPTVDYNILTFDYQGHNVGRHFLTCYLDRNTPNELMCDDKYGFNLVAQSWMEDDSLAGDVQTESINLSWNISNDAATKGWVKAQQYLNARDLEDYDFASRTELNEGLDTKQDKLTAGANITISGNTISAKDTTYTAGENVHINGTVISATDTNTTYSAGTGLNLNGTTFSVNNTIATKSDLNAKQDKLTAGSNIQINGNTISATDTKYTAGTNVQINNKVISATDTKYTAGTGLALNGTTFSVNNTIATKNDLNAKQDKLTAGSNIQINGNTISATDTKYTAGENITIENNVISSTGGATYTASAPLNIDANDNISIDLSDYATKNDLNDKQDTLTAGANITIDNNTISATDTTYSAGNGLSLSGTEFAVDTTVVATQTDLSGKQDTLTAGSNITINNDTISATDTTYSAGTGLDLTGTEFSVDTTTIATKTDLNDKQDTLTAGANITIDNNTISATDTTYTAGDGLDFANNEFSVNSTIARVTDLASKQDVLTPGNNITISSDDVISATDTTYTAGNGLDLTGTQFSVDTTVVATQNDLSGKQDTLTAGSNISINNNTISATDTTYSAGNGLSLSGTEFSADTTVLATQNDLSGKQDTLTAGSNITISNDTISAADTTYSAGDGIAIDANNVISVTGDHDYNKDYLTFEALEDGTFSYTRTGTTADISYSVDNGATWTTLSAGDSTPTITTGNKILWKCDRSSYTYDNSNYNTFSSTGQFKVYGNSMSMIYGDNFANQTSFANISLALNCLLMGCSYLTDAENMILPATTLNGASYHAVFKNCTSLVTAPKILPAKTLTQACYHEMFLGCTSLVNAPIIAATGNGLARDCCYQMFKGCTSLVTAPDLLATGAASALSSWGCYGEMFNGCTHLKYIKCLYTGGTSTMQFNSWVTSVPSGGTFIKNAAATWTTGVIPSGWTTLYETSEYADITPTSGSANSITSGGVYTALQGKQDVLTAGSNITISNNVISSSGTPFHTLTQAEYDVLPEAQKNNGTVYIISDYTPPTYTAGTGISIDANNVISATGGGDVPYEEQYLTFEALADGTFSYSREDGVVDVYYSLDGGSTWTTLAEDTQTPTVTTGNKILWKSDRTNDSYDYWNRKTPKFSSTANCNIYGNIMSMHYGDNFVNNNTLPADRCFSAMFRQIKVVDAGNLILPATILRQYCYTWMFYENTTLTIAPTLPATTLAAGCYSNMFRSCTSLTTAPELPATTLDAQCYCEMFEGCTSLTEAPELPATTLASQCYSDMFSYCSSLIKVHELPALTLEYSSYSCMFMHCTQLNYVKMLATDVSATYCLADFLTSTAATGTFVKNVNATWNDADVVPAGWTVKYEETGYVDKTPTSGSNNTITSGAVYTALQNAGQTYTAGTGLSLSNNEFSVDTTTIATKSYVDTQVGDITNILATI